MQIHPLLKRLASPALAAYGLKALNAIAAFIATALIARIAGPAVVGDYGFAVLTGTLLGLLALRGLDQIGLRQIAGDLRNQDTASARGILRYTSRSVTIATALLSDNILSVIRSHLGNGGLLKMFLQPLPPSE